MPGPESSIPSAQLGSAGATNIPPVEHGSGQTGIGTEFSGAASHPIIFEEDGAARHPSKARMPACSSFDNAPGNISNEDPEICSKSKQVAEEVLQEIEGKRRCRRDEAVFETPFLEDFERRALTDFSCYAENESGNFQALLAGAHATARRKLTRDVFALNAIEKYGSDDQKTRGKELARKLCKHFCAEEKTRVKDKDYISGFEGNNPGENRYQKVAREHGKITALFREVAGSEDNVKKMLDDLIKNDCVGNVIKYVETKYPRMSQASLEDLKSANGLISGPAMKNLENHMQGLWSAAGETGWADAYAKAARMALLVPDYLRQLSVAEAPPGNDGRRDLAEPQPPGNLDASIPPPSSDPIRPVSTEGASGIANNPSFSSVNSPHNAAPTFQAPTFQAPIIFIDVSKDGRESKPPSVSRNRDKPADVQDALDVRSNQAAVINATPQSANLSTHNTSSSNNDERVNTSASQSQHSTSHFSHSSTEESSRAQQSARNDGSAISLLSESRGGPNDVDSQSERNAAAYSSDGHGSMGRGKEAVISVPQSEVQNGKKDYRSDSKDESRDSAVGESESESDKDSSSSDQKAFASQAQFDARDSRNSYRPDSMDAPDDAGIDSGEKNQERRVADEGKFGLQDKVVGKSLVSDSNVKHRETNSESGFVKFSLNSASKFSSVSFEKTEAGVAITGANRGKVGWNAGNSEARNTSDLMPRPSSGKDVSYWDLGLQRVSMSVRKTLVGPAYYPSSSNQLAAAGNTAAGVAGAQAETEKHMGVANLSQNTSSDQAVSLETNPENEIATLSFDGASEFSSASSEKTEAGMETSANRGKAGGNDESSEAGSAKSDLTSRPSSEKDFSYLSLPSRYASMSVRKTLVGPAYYPSSSNQLVAAGNGIAGVAGAQAATEKHMGVANPGQNAWDDRTVGPDGLSRKKRWSVKENSPLSTTARPVQTGPRHYS